MIERVLEEYKRITEKIIEIIDKDEEVIKLLEKREELINNLFNTEEKKEVIREIYLSKNLLNLDEELKTLIATEKGKVKEEIKKLHKIKNANNVYEKNRKINSFFSTKI